MDPKTQITWYVARTHDGLFNQGSGWTQTLANARFHKKVGPVKSAVSKYAKKNPDQPVPQILEWRVDIATATVLDVAEQTTKRIQRRAIAKIKRERQNAERSLGYLEQERARLNAREQELRAKL